MKLLLFLCSLFLSCSEEITIAQKVNNETLRFSFVIPNRSYTPISLGSVREEAELRSEEALSLKNLGCTVKKEEENSYLFFCSQKIVPFLFAGYRTFSYLFFSYLLTKRIAQKRLSSLMDQSLRQGIPPKKLPWWLSLVSSEEKVVGSIYVSQTRALSHYLTCLLLSKKFALKKNNEKGFVALLKEWLLEMDQEVNCQKENQVPLLQLQQLGFQAPFLEEEEDLLFFFANFSMHKGLDKAETSTFKKEGIMILRKGGPIWRSCQEKFRENLPKGDFTPDHTMNPTDDSLEPTS